MTLENVQGSVADFRRGREPAQSNFRQKVQICTKINTSFNLTSFFFLWQFNSKFSEGRKENSVLRNAQGLQLTICKCSKNLLKQFFNCP
jgi:hypothetical protein